MPPWPRRPPSSGVPGPRRPGLSSPTATGCGCCGSAGGVDGPPDGLRLCRDGRELVGSAHLPTMSRTGEARGEESIVHLFSLGFCFANFIQHSPSQGLHHRLPSPARLHACAPCMPAGRSRRLWPRRSHPRRPATHPPPPSPPRGRPRCSPATMSLSLFPRAVAPLRLAARSAAPSAGVLTRWAASTPATAAPATAGATPTPAPAPAVVPESTAGVGLATTATSSARNSPVANLQGAQPIGNSEYVVRLGGPSGKRRRRLPMRVVHWGVVDGLALFFFWPTVVCAVESVEKCSWCGLVLSFAVLGVGLWERHAQWNNSPLVGARLTLLLVGSSCCWPALPLLHRHVL